MKSYHDFIKSKIATFKDSGFDISEKKLNPLLFPFQAFIVKKSLKKGRYAIFADCGLGKTFMQLEWSKHVCDYTKGIVLILCPLAVSGQTIEEGKVWGIPVTKLDVSNLPDKGIWITNYEQLPKITDQSPEFIEKITGIVLDESSILKNYTGKYKRLIISTFKNTPYKLTCTATPSPNDYNELGNHSEFLNVLDAQDMRSRWFVRDEGMNNYRLKKHGEVDFFKWVSSWATMLSKPSDLKAGFSDEGYELPELRFIEKRIITDCKENGKLFNDTAVNATNFNAELRNTMAGRLKEVAKIVNQSDESFIIWVNQNNESKMICDLIGDAVEVRGSEPQSAKEGKLLGFAKNEFRVLVTKKKIAQFGLNYQNCHNQIFASLDFSYEGLYQSIRRSYRFGQAHDVNIYVITTDTMQNVLSSINRKQIQFTTMQQHMNKAINSEEYRLSLEYDFMERKKKGKYWIMRGDSVKEMARIPDNSIDLSVFSPPFSSLFTYSDNWHDMGNCSSHDEFFEQYSYLLKELYRVMKPGRLVCCHTKDLALYKNSSGFSGIYDFTGDHTRAMLDAGFKLHSKVNIWTDPVLEMQRTKTQRLLYKQLRKDSSYSGVGLPEYFFIFRKWEGDEKEWAPITNKNEENFPLDTWQKWASPVWSTEESDIEELNEMLKLYTTQTWFDISRTDVLNSYEGTDTGDEKHIAPLQLSVIRRAVVMWSNPGEVVFDPFGGIMSTGYEALKNGRQFVGIELKQSYFETGEKNLKRAIAKSAQMELFF